MHNGLLQNVEKAKGLYMNGDTERTAHLGDKAEANLLNMINRYDKMGEKGWQMCQNCAKFANDAWNAGTGENYDYDTGGILTPTVLHGRISDANHYGYTPPKVLITTPSCCGTYVNTPSVYIQPPTTPPSPYGRIN